MFGKKADLVSRAIQLHKKAQQWLVDIKLNSLHAADILGTFDVRCVLFCLNKQKGSNRTRFDSLSCIASQLCHDVFKASAVFKHLASFSFKSSGRVLKRRVYVANFVATSAS